MSEPNEKNGPAGDDGEEAAVPSSATGIRNSSAPEGDDPIAAAKAEAARFKDQWMRSAADFDNFRKRSRKELEDTRKAGKEDLLKDLLPVFDNLERAITSADRATEVKPVAEGLKLVLRQFLDTLGRSGITKVSTTGHPFDPSMHEAIQQVETDEVAPGTVMAEVQPGYLQGDRLVRAAMVVVAKPRAGNDGGDAS